MFSNMFVPESECEALLGRIREIMDDEGSFAFEKVEDIVRLLKKHEAIERARNSESPADIY